MKLISFAILFSLSTAANAEHPQELDEFCANEITLEGLHDLAANTEWSTPSIDQELQSDRLIALVGALTMYLPNPAGPPNGALERELELRNEKKKADTGSGLIQGILVIGDPITHVLDVGTLISDDSNPMAVETLSERFETTKCRVIFANGDETPVSHDRRKSDESGGLQILKDHSALVARTTFSAKDHDPQIFEEAGFGFAAEISVSAWFSPKVE